MKKLTSILLALSIIKVSISQTRNDIFTSKQVFFYGYDFTHFKITEAKRMGQESQIKGVVFEIISIMNTKKPEKKYTSLLKKETVIFDQESVNALNKKINTDGIVEPFAKNIIPYDSLQIMVNRYNTEGKTGIGFVQIIECLYRPDKEASVWYVFFDIATKKILDAKEMFNNDADSYHGLAIYWCVGLSCELGQYRSKYYMKELKKYNSK